MPKKKISADHVGYLIKDYIVKCISLIIYLSLILFHNFYVVSYSQNNPSLNTAIQSIFSSNILSSIGYIYSDIMMMCFGKPCYVFSLLPCLWIIRNLYAKRIQYPIYIKLLFSLTFIVFFSFFYYLVQVKLPYFSFDVVSNKIPHHVSLINLIVKKFLTNSLYIPSILISLFGFLISCFIASQLKLTQFIEIFLILPTLLIKFCLYTYLELKHIFVNLLISLNLHKQNQLHKNTKNQVNTNINLDGSFILPSTNILNATKKDTKNKNPQQIESLKEQLLNILKDFGISGKIVNIKEGPVVTIYEFEPLAGIKSSRIIGLADDIARSLSAVSTRIANIPGRNVLGIEIPNESREFFGIRELLETKEYKDTKHHLPIILGKSITGTPKIVDLAQMPHLLIAGTTGSGKSVSINTIILSLIYAKTPEECQFIMIDPKMLELSSYEEIPHLMTPVVTNAKQAVATLKWVVQEMERRYALMSNFGVKSIHSYNQKSMKNGQLSGDYQKKIQIGFDKKTNLPIYEVQKHEYKKLPFIVVLVDEMADLMLISGKEIEISIQRLAQMARASGIHLIMATQRPSVDVITGVIKANFPSRVSFKVASKIDSRTILGESGAEQLLGMGDMLYMGNGMEINRIHGPFVSENEVETVVQYLKSQPTNPNAGYVTQDILNIAESDQKNTNNTSYFDVNEESDIYKQAVQIVISEQKASISYIQRKLRIGYNKAASLIERMEQENIVSPQDITGKRKVIQK